MKLVLVILVMSIMVMSCANPLDYYMNATTEITDMIIQKLLFNKDIYDHGQEWDNIKNIGDIYSWINKNITFTYDELEYIQSPQETVIRGKGDCDDFAVLYANMAWVCLGIKMDIIYISTSGLPLPNHAIVYWVEKNIYLEPQNGGGYNKVDVIFRYSFNKVFE